MHAASRHRARRDAFARSLAGPAGPAHSNACARLSRRPRCGPFGRRSSQSPPPGRGKAAIIEGAQGGSCAGKLRQIEGRSQAESEESKIVIASWNVNSIRARIDHVTTWLQAHTPDILLLQELKTPEFPDAIFKDLGYHVAAVTQKAYNGVAILSRTPIEVVSTTLAGDEADSHARFLEVLIDGMRIVNIYLPNGNPIGTEKFDYKLAWMDRLTVQMAAWLRSDIPTIIGGDFNVIPEEIDCHKPASWMKDALFQPETRSRYRDYLEIGYTDAFRTLHPGEPGQFTFWDYFRDAFAHNRGIRIDHFLLSPAVAERLTSCTIDKAPRAQAKPSDHTPILIELS